MWRYNEGDATHVGIGHSGEVTRLKICPLQQHIVSVSTDGAVLRWKFPNPPGEHHEWGKWFCKRCK